MKKLLIKTFMPSAKTLAEIAARSFQKAVNGSGREDALARWASLADSFLGFSKKLSGTLSDGKIDETERAEIAAMLEPALAKLVQELVK